MGTGPWISSSDTASGPDGDELLSTLQGGRTYDLLPVPLADGMGRAPVDNNCLPESGDNSQILRMPSLGAHGLLGDVVPTGGVPLQLERRSDGGCGQASGCDAG